MGGRTWWLDQAGTTEGCAVLGFLSYFKGRTKDQAPGNWENLGEANSFTVAGPPAHMQDPYCYPPPKIHT